MIKKQQKKKNNCETDWGRDQFVRIYLVKKGLIEVIWSYCKFPKIFVYNFTVFRNDIMLNDFVVYITNANYIKILIPQII